MIAINLITPHEMLELIAEKVKAKRLFLNLSQQTLSSRSGVSYGVIKKFERTGKISLESLLKLALVLEALNDFEHVFAPPKPEQALTLDALMKEKPYRKRGRK